MARHKKKIMEATRALERAESYTHWLEAAAELDRLEESDAWREDPRSPHYDHELIADHLQRMRAMRLARDARGLRNLLQESLHRSLGDLSNQALYEYAYMGTKRLIEEYLDEIERALCWLRDTPLPGFPTERKLEVVKHALHLFGRSALILSGGGALGLFHLGVVKAMWERGTLPEIISGASMGAIVAGGVCTRDDVGLAQMWESVESIHRTATRIQSPFKWGESGSILAPDQLAEHVEANLGDYTFEEARRRSGRVLNIPVSPVRRRQKPRLLNHLTSPDVLITDAAIASCSLPALFPPGKLRRRVEGGQLEPYIRGEVWVDGSIYSDVPVQRLGRLLNVNHFIVSQANPHVIPISAIERRRGAVSTAADFLAGGARAQARHALNTARRRLGDSQWRAPLEFAHAMAHQDYTGNITIYPKFKARDLTRVMKNPSLEELHGYIRAGERATWPRLAMIRDQTRISRVMVACVKELERRQAGLGRQDDVKA